VARIVAQIRRRWPLVRILLRADSGFAREELMAWCEANGVHFLKPTLPPRSTERRCCRHRSRLVNVRTQEESERLERLLENDPLVAHDRIMRATRPPMPMIVHKEYSGRQPPLTTVAHNGDEQPLQFSDDQIDVLAQTLVDLRSEFQSMVDDAISPLRERLAWLEGEIAMLTTLLSNNNSSNNSRSLEASEIIRKLKVDDRS
jgi:hypothetical protein